MHTRCKAVHSVDESLNNSASGKMIQLQDVDSSFIEHDDGFDGYRVIYKTTMFRNIQNFGSCKNRGEDIKLTEKCGEDIKLTEKYVRGLSSVFPIECKNYNDFCSLRNSKSSVNEKNIPEINRRFVYALRTIGQGHSAMTTFCGVTDFPPPVAAYNNIINKLQLCSKEVSMQSATLKEVTLTYSSDIVISGDGTWKTRGDSSRVTTRGLLVTDHVILNHGQVTWTTPELASVTASNLHGDDIVVSKIECVGHVQKRKGTGLRKLKQMSSKLSDRKSIDEKGRLTERMIVLITTYYGNAIRQNKTCLSDIRKDVWAVYFHIRSSDEEPLHSFCPVGPNYWCQYQNQVLEGSVEGNF
ncbi:uncharacterized protein TNCV_4171551 [Trichonephila clavipes]|nr:uncharacterized protein TNCV_4171551 [Trichonephila clavipes]